MPEYINCRDSKTAEEYLLKCLFQAEDERDKAIAYCNQVKAEEEARIKQAEEDEKAFQEKLKEAPVFKVQSTETVKYEIAPSYHYKNESYGLNDTSELQEILELNDEDFWEWARKVHQGETYYTTLPIKRILNTYDYMLIEGTGEEQNIYVSDYRNPSYFLDYFTDNTPMGELLDIELDEQAKSAAISNCREIIQESIESLLKEQDK